MEEQGKNLHIVMFPWLGFGHLRPFFHLSECLARKGHRITFISTPRNLERAVKVPQDLSHLIYLASFPLPEVEHLPAHAESPMDVPHVKQELLKVALDLLEPKIRSFLEEMQPKPDWVVYDFAYRWLPRLAQEIGISRAFFSIFNAAFLAFLGPPSVLTSLEYMRPTAEEYTIIPEWTPFTSNMVFRLHEMTRYMEKEYDSGTSDVMRLGLSVDGSDIVIIKSCAEFEPEWFDLVYQLYQKPIIPVGVLTTGEEDGEDETENDVEWTRIKEWLDLQKENSLVYVALGTEEALTQNETHELALGLEQCGLPFFWVVRNYQLEMLPDGFVDRVRNRGMVHTKWAPQIKILGHKSIGGCLTHCGWSSATEALGFGRVLILFPVMNDQGLNARLLQGKKVGVEIPRNEKDGSFTSEMVAKTVRLALIDEEERAVRENARKMKELFGDKSRSNNYIDRLVHQMKETRGRSSS